MEPDPLVHVRDNRGRTLCGDAGASITMAEARDPVDGRHFTCGACWKILAGGVEPMGGT